MENLLDLIYEHYTENNPVEKNTVAGKAAKAKEKELEEWLRGLEGMDRLVDDYVGDKIPLLRCNFVAGVDCHAHADQRATSEILVSLHQGDESVRVRPHERYRPHCGLTLLNYYKQINSYLQITYKVIDL